MDETSHSAQGSIQEASWLRLWNWLLAPDDELGCAICGDKLSGSVDVAQTRDGTICQTCRDNRPAPEGEQDR